MAGLTWATYKTQIATMAVVDEDDENFNIVLPQASENANLRICRDLDFLESSVSTTASLAAGSRRITIPTATLVVSEQINVLLPAGSSNPETSERQPLTAVTKEVLDVVYGSSSYRDTPEYYCPFDQGLFLVGPFADANYTVEIVGTMRPAPLSETETTTFISQFFPDLLIAATMITISGYQRNFGSMSDDPRMALSWSQQYQELLQGASIEENRKKYQASAWSSEASSPIATPSR